MERLTERELNNVENVSYCKCFFKDCDGNCQRCELQYEADMKLKHYEDLEEQGLLLKLPCKVGDTVYEVKESITTNGYCIIPRKIRTLTLLMILAGDFGKTVFLTKEEAEAKLKELENV